MTLNYGSHNLEKVKGVIMYAEVNNASKDPRYVNGWRPNLYRLVDFHVTPQPDDRIALKT